MIRRQIADDAHTRPKCLHAQQLEVAQLDGHIHLFLFMRIHLLAERDADIAGCQRLAFALQHLQQQRGDRRLAVRAGHRAITEMLRVTVADLHLCIDRDALLHEMLHDRDTIRDPRILHHIRPVLMQQPVRMSAVCDAHAQALQFMFLFYFPAVGQRDRAAVRTQQARGCDAAARSADDQYIFHITAPPATDRPMRR